MWPVLICFSPKPFHKLNVMHLDPFGWFLLSGLHRIKYNPSKLGERYKKYSFAKWILKKERGGGCASQQKWTIHFVNCRFSETVACFRETDADTFTKDNSGLKYELVRDAKVEEVMKNLLQRTTRLTPLPRRPKRPVMRVATPDSQNFHSCAYQVVVINALNSGSF